MSIPLMKVPEYDLTLSNNVKIKYRPFLVKEQKLLLLSNENQNESEMVNILIDIVQACVKGDIDVKKLPVYDFEWLWLNIRSKSIGEVVNLKLKCPDDETQVVDYELKIEDVKPDLNKKINTKIEFTKDYGVMMRIPTIKEVANKRTILDMSINLMRDCIDQIYQGEELFEAKGHEVIDLGPHSKDRVDYPDYAAKVCKEVLSNEGSKGILICEYPEILKNELKQIVMKCFIMLILIF